MIITTPKPAAPKRRPASDARCAHVVALATPAPVRVAAAQPPATQRRLRRPRRTS